jgi:hypothetical protein
MLIRQKEENGFITDSLLKITKPAVKCHSFPSQADLY